MLAFNLMNVCKTISQYNFQQTLTLSSFLTQKVTLRLTGPILIWSECLMAFQTIVNVFSRPLFTTSNGIHQDLVLGRYHSQFT